MLHTIPVYCSRSFIEPAKGRLCQSPLGDRRWRRTRALNDLFEDTLKDIYYAENKILKALPKMAKAAHSDELRAAFQKHLKETEGQVSRLEKVFKLADLTPSGEKCEAIEGILEEGAEIMKEFKGAPALDAGLVSRPRPSSITRSRAMGR